MNFLLSLALSSLPAFGAADALPPYQFIQDHFPKATNCSFVTAFSNGSTCGAKRSEIWACWLEEKRTEFLVTGRIDSDVSGECSPTFVPEHALREE